MIMPLKTPSFWYAPVGIKAILLTPLSWLYRLGSFIDQKLKAKQSYKSNIPVICIGNAVAGGSGKTPTAIALLKLLEAKNPHFLLRGYGGSITSATVVDITKHTAKDVGDEAMMLANHAPTIISPNRAEGAKLAEENGADIILMDDGLQNNSLHKDISFLVVDGITKFGNNKLIPAGPLREPIRKVMNRIDAVIYIGGPLHSDKPVFQASLEPSAELDTSKNYVAFAGIGRPEKFKYTLESLGANLVGWHAFADHHDYIEVEIKMLKDEASKQNTILITTEKDYVRLPIELREGIETLPVHINFKEDNDLKKFLGDHLKDLR